MNRKNYNNKKTDSSGNILPFQKRTGIGITADGLVNCITGLGTAGDKRSYYTYKQVTQLQMQDLNNMYRQSWISKRIVNIVPYDMTRKWREINLDSPRKIKKIQDYEKKIKLQEKLIQAMIWGRLYGGAIIVMITDDMDLNDPESCSTPLDLSKMGKDSLKSLLIFDRWRIYPSVELISDITSSEFEQPEYYVITSNPSIIRGVPRIHHSRVLRFDGDIIPYYPYTQNARWHDSVLQSVYDSIVNNESAKQSVASMMSEAYLDVYQYAGLRETLAETEDGEQLISLRVKTTNLSKSISNAIILDAEDKYDKKETQFSNLDNLLLQSNIDVCGAAQIPMSILFGQSATGLNNSGESDETKHYDNIQFHQEHFLRPQLEKLDKILIPSALGKMPDDFEFIFPSLWQESDLDQSTIDLNNAKRDEIYLTNFVLSEQNVADKLVTTKVYNKIDLPEKPDPIELAKAGATGSNNNNNKSNTNAKPKTSTTNKAK